MGRRNKPRHFSAYHSTKGLHLHYGNLRQIWEWNSGGQLCKVIGPRQAGQPVTLTSVDTSDISNMRIQYACGSACPGSDPSSSTTRQPTLNKVRCFDREIMKETCRFLSRGQGSMEAGVDHYSNRQDEALWQLLRPLPKSLPDQGVDAGAVTSLGADKNAARERASKRPISPEKPPTQEAGQMPDVRQEARTPLPHARRFPEEAEREGPPRQGSGKAPCRRQEA